MYIYLAMKAFVFHKMIKIFPLLTVLLIFPVFVFAQIVPCGGPGQPDCELCHIFVMFGNLVNFILFDIVPPVAVIALVSGGILFYFSIGASKRIATAKKIIESTIIGIFIVYFAGLIIGMIFLAAGAADWETWWWGNISC